MHINILHIQNIKSIRRERGNIPKTKVKLKQTQLKKSPGELIQAIKNIHALEKEMATHSNVLARRIPGTGEPGGLPSMSTGSHRVGHD